MQVYPQVMHSVIGELKENGIFSGKFSNGYRTNEMVQALVEGPNDRLVDRILYNSHSGTDSIRTILSGYLNRGNIKGILDFLEHSGGYAYDLHVSKFSNLIVQKGSDRDIEKLLSLGKAAEIFKYKVISGLYRVGRIDLAGVLIQQHYPQQQCRIVEVINRIEIGELMEEEVIISAVRDLLLTKQKKGEELYGADPITILGDCLLHGLFHNGYNHSLIQKVIDQILASGKGRISFSIERETSIKDTPYVSDSQDDDKIEARRTMADRIDETTEILAYMRLGEKGNEIALHEHFEDNVRYGNSSADWFGATLLLRQNPKQFTAIFTMITEFAKGANDEKYLIGMEEFLYESFKLERFEIDTFRQSFISRLSDLCRQEDRGAIPIPRSVTINLVQKFVSEGSIEEAWKALCFLRDLGDKMRDWSSVPIQVYDEAMGIIIKALNHYDIGGISKSFRGNKVSDEVVEGVEYHNTEMEVSLALGNEESIELHRKKLLSRITTPEAARRWIKLMNAGTLRDKVGKREELSTVYSSSQQDLIRWRMIDAMIEAKIPGVEALPEIQSKSTPFRVARYFFRKLEHNDFFHNWTFEYLHDSTHIPFLRRLLAEYQNEFNTVMETLDALKTAETLALRSEENSHREITIKDYQDIEDKYKNPKIWDGIFTILRTIGICTPTIYIEARKVGFDESKLEQIGEKITEIKKQFFRNEPVDMSLGSDIVAEVICAAYKPANIHLLRVKKLCPELHDCTHHISHFSFDQSGYPLNFTGKRKMKLRDSDSAIESLPDREEIVKVFQEARGVVKWDSENIRDKVRKLCDIGRFKMSDEIGLQDIFVPFAQDSYLGPLLLIIGGDENNIFTELINAQEGFGVYFKDNLEQRILDFFRDNSSDISQMIENFASSLKTEKRKRVVKQQLGINIDEIDSLGDIELVARVISEVILQKFTPLQYLRKKIRKDIGKFVADDGTEVKQTDKQYKAYFSKNISSFFAKSSAGICTAADTDLFHREDHFHLNIVDESKQICVGNVQCYIMLYKGKKHLLLRGFNPSTNLLKDIDPGTFCEEILDICKGFCKDNNLEGIILSENRGSYHALSNRPSVKAYLEKRYRSGEIAIDSFPIAGKTSIEKGYLLAA